MNKKLVLWIICVLFFNIALAAENKVTTHATIDLSGSFSVNNFLPELTVYNVTANAGDLVEANYTVFDPNGGNVTITFYSPLNASGQWQTTAADQGTTYAVIRASKGNLSVAKTMAFKLSVLSEERPSSGGGGSPGCRAEWECTDWGQCINWSQTRKCNKIGDDCDIGSKPREMALCVPDDYDIVEIGEYEKVVARPIEEEPKEPVEEKPLQVEEKVNIWDTILIATLVIFTLSILYQFLRKLIFRKKI